jgi:hypothetical protein
VKKLTNKTASASKEGKKASVKGDNKTSKSVSAKKASNTSKASAKAAPKKAAKTAKPVAKKKTATKKPAKIAKVVDNLDKIVPAVEDNKPQETVIKKDNPDPKITFETRTVNLTREGATQFRAKEISRNSFPLNNLHIARLNVLDKLQVMGTTKERTKELTAQLDEINTKIREAESAVNSLREMSIADCYEIENVSVPSLVKIGKSFVDDFATRCAVALGFKPSKIKFIAG